ncbi:MAG: cache domain-containing protein [Treponemataceae bacterium]
MHGAPVYDNEHNFIGALAADIAFDNMDNRIKKLEIGKNGYSYIIGGTGNLIAHKNIDIRTLTNISDVEKRSREKRKK